MRRARWPVGLSLFSKKFLDLGPPLHVIFLGANEPSRIPFDCIKRLYKPQYLYVSKISQKAYHFLIWTLTFCIQLSFDLFDQMKHSTPLFIEYSTSISHNVRPSILEKALKADKLI